MQIKTAWTIVATMMLLSASLAFRIAKAANPEAPPAVKALADLPVSDDAGTDLVVAFYMALVQEEPPTLEQEKALFGDASRDMRGRLLAKGHGTDDDPVIVNYVRERKHLFFPKNMQVPLGSEKSLQAIQLTSTFRFVRSLRWLKEGEFHGPGYGYVLALFIDDVQPAPPERRLRTIVFPLVKGKINAGGIRLDGFQGPSLEDDRE